ncbi:hypothetical protein CcaverHIS631_0402980 [Cutaneotrichosporon cavernicola]|nr:hypothetical protein CcaverHIS631_0402980 [Cutaneotrichosporon cavernicola]BEJ07032.1 hypothetical protein CcaverHIS641_0403010 [Cutaneotrichosporon cavernicola]
MATPSVSPAKSSSVASSQRENEHLRKRVRLQVQTRPATTSSRDARLELLRASVATAEQTYLGQVSKMAKELKELGEDFNRHMTALKEELKKVQDEPVQ